MQRTPELSAQQTGMLIHVFVITLYINLKLLNFITVMPDLIRLYTDLFEFC